MISFYLNPFLFCYLTFSDATQFCLPILKYIMDKGNTTTFEWRIGEPPEVVEVTTPLVPLDVDSGSNETPDDQVCYN